MFILFDTLKKYCDAMVKKDTDSMPFSSYLENLKVNDQHFNESYL